MIEKFKIILKVIGILAVIWFFGFIARTAMAAGVSPMAVWIIVGVSCALIVFAFFAGRMDQ